MDTLIQETSWLDNKTSYFLGWSVTDVSAKKESLVCVPCKLCICLVTVWPIKIRFIFSTDLRRDAEYHREQTLHYSVRKSKVLQMQPRDEVQDIMW